MQEYELQEIISNLPYLNRPEWEQARFIAYVEIQTKTKKKLSLQDIIKFPWESTTESKELTTEEINEMKSKAEQIKQQFYNNGRIKH
ncbi:MAG: hypothetical protein HFJ94_03855 [Muribaculaceae bacterium]|nr:hypothetical protein [Muribaculaceae bacterium]